MLLSLSIRDIVLIDRLDLEWQPTLCTLTGETGAGKSILLDALGLRPARAAMPVWCGKAARKAASRRCFSCPKNINSKNFPVRTASMRAARFRIDFASAAIG